MKRNILKSFNFLFVFSFLVLVLALFLLSACSSSDNSASLVKTNNEQNASVSAVDATKNQLPVVEVSSFEKLLALNEPTTITDADKTATVKITGASSNDDSAVLSVKQGTGENVKKVLENQVISFGTLRICVSDIIIDSSTGDVQVKIIPTYSQNAVAWFSMVVPKDVNKTCDVFERAVSSSSKSQGAATFFLDEFKAVSDDDFARDAYESMLGKKITDLDANAWNFYVSENGRLKFLELLIASDDFKKHESSIK